MKITAFLITVAIGGALVLPAQTPAPQQQPSSAVPAPAQQGRGRGQGFQPPMPPGPNPNSQYRLGPDSLPQDGVPKGEIRGPFTLPSKVYPGTQHTYWVYVPAQYDPKIPTAMMI